MGIIEISGAVICILSIWLNLVGGDGNLDFVTRECNNGLRNIDSIGKFELFVTNYKRLIASSEKPKRGLLNLDKKLRKCYDLEEALRELESIVSDRDGRVCQMSYINRLVRFHDTFLTNTKKSDDAHREGENSQSARAVGSESSYLARFFSLFAHQVVSTCKSKLASRLEEAQKKQDCSTVLAKYLPPARESEGENNDINDVMKFMSHFKNVEEFMPISHIDSLNNKEFYYDIIISPEIVEKIQDLRADCRAREPYYLALFSPISTLAHLGYSTEESSSSADVPETRETKILRCWLATAQLCQGILRTHPVVHDDLEHVDKPVTVKFGPVPEDAGDDKADEESLEFSDTIFEINPEIHEIVKKKFTATNKLKRKGQRMLREIVERHINVDALRQDALEKFMTSLTADDDGIDTRVAFSGKQNTGGQYNPAKVITDDVDTFFQMATVFISGKVSLVFSCIVGVALSAVFIWFSLYAMVTAIKHGISKSDEKNFKTEWRELRDSRMNEIRKRFDKTNPKDHLKVYKPE